MRILIVDDHKILRRGLREVVAEQFPGSEFGEADSSQSAVAAVHDWPWDLMLLDINIPGRSGLEVLKEVKQVAPKMPVLVISAYPEEDFAVRALKLRASGYLTKSSVADELPAAMKKALSGGRYVTAAVAEKLADSMGSDLKSSAHETLSNRELQVLRLITTGRNLKEIAAELCLSEKTVGTYRNRVATKLGLSSNVELARYALQHGLADP